MTIWPVVVQDWQLECCGDPFQIGDEVTWTLVMVDANDKTPVEMLIEATMTVEGVATSEQGQRGCGISAGDLHAWRPGDPPGRGEVSIRGLLVEEHHGAIPANQRPTRGIVRRICLVTQPYHHVGNRKWEPVSANADFQDLASSPLGFDGDLDSGGAVRRVETGLLVDLEVAGT